MIGLTLRARTPGTADIQIVAQSGNGAAWIAVPVEGGSPFEISPGDMNTTYDVPPTAPSPGDEAAGWRVLADHAETNRRSARADLAARLSPEDIFAQAGSEAP